MRLEGLKRPAVFVHETVWAVSMPIGARVFADEAVHAAGLSTADRVVDIGCGPGTATRAAARLGVRAIGVDPTPMMFTVARMLTKGAIRERISWREGLAEAIPVDDAEATVVFAIRSAHHFDDPSSAFAEMRRVLVPGGRVVIVERALRTKSGLRHGHGFSPDGAEEMAKELESSGFDQVKVETRRTRRGAMVVLTARRP